MAGPCPCMPLQRGTVIVAIIDAVLNIILLALLILAFIGILTIEPGSRDAPDITKSEKTQLTISVLFAIIICICQIALAIYLRRSAYQNNYHGCKKWLIITVILFVISIISTAIGIAAGSGALDIISNVIGILYRLYVMVVVYCFMKELINGGGSNYYSNAAVTIE